MASGWAASALDWWEEAGVDTIVGEAPRDWLAPKAKAAEAPPAAPAPDKLPADLDGFRAWLLGSDLAGSGIALAPEGDPASGLMMMIDMPSPEDAAAGGLLSGEIGAMFDRMLARMGRSRETIYLAPMLPVRNPAGKLPPNDVERIAQIARHHIGLAAPRALLLFGDECSKALLGRAVALARGSVHAIETGAGPVPAFVTMSLQMLLKLPERRRDAMADIEMVMAELDK